jgi:CHAT domain-containing protein
VEALVKAYEKSLEYSWGDPLANHDAAGQKLWSALLEHVAPEIPKGSRLIVIPDGALHRLNLETLLVPGPVPHYWIEDVEIAVAPSITVLTAEKPSPVEAHTPSLLLIGAPTAVPGFDKLPQAEAEIGAIQKRFPDAAKEVLTGPFATPAAYKQAGPERFSLIHFAAHAEANQESPLESAVILSPKDNLYRLHAREIIDSKLTADLVTISGCRSAGVRTYAGEGLIGFAWAFLQAGSRAVIAGLWNINDGSSKPLMDGLYGDIAAGQNAVTALRNAKLAMLKGDPQYRKPYFWAPFQIYVRTL